MTVAEILAKGHSAVAYCGNAACVRFRDFAGRALDLKGVPGEASVEAVQAALVCSSCDRRLAAVQVVRRPEWIDLRTLGRILLGLPAVERAPGEPAPLKPEDHPLVKATLAAFPGAVIEAVRPRHATLEAAA